MPKRNAKRYTIEQNHPKSVTGSRDGAVERNERNDPITVFIVGDSHLVRSGLRRILESQSAICVLGDVSVRQASVDSISHYSPDVVLIDLDARVTNVLELIGALHDASEKLAILVLIELGDHDVARKALALGASGIVLRVQPPGVLIAAVRDSSMTRSGVREDTEAANGGKLIGRSTDSETMIKVHSLTSRERDIIRLLGQGLRNKDIANQLSISDITVRHHLSSIFCKLEVADRQKLLILAHQYGLADLTLTVTGQEAS